MVVLGTVVAWLLLAWVALLFVPFRWRPLGVALFVPTMFAQALTPFVAVTAAVLTAVGVLIGAWPMAGAALVATLGASTVVVRVGALDGGWRGRLPRVAEPSRRPDVVFATVPGTGRPLLCDVWEPPSDVARSGTAIVYLHSSAWAVFDKDAGTRPLFGQLTSQGHVIVDVAYRLFPETDIPGMVADADRAVAWVKVHAADLGVDPGRVVLAGGSAGGHLALLAAYTADDPALRPADVGDVSVRVAGVVSLYGQADLAAMYEHTGQAASCRPDDPQPDWDAPPPAWARRLFGDGAARNRVHLIPWAGRCDWLVGGTPDQVPDRYRQLSPLHRVHPGCPATLLIHGQHDVMAPVTATRRLEQRLRDAGVPVTALYLPHTDHAFDLVATVWAPPARVAIHTLERFLASISARPAPVAASAVEEERP